MIVIPKRVWIVNVAWSFDGHVNNITINECFELKNKDNKTAVIPVDEYSKVILAHHSNQSIDKLIESGASLYDTTHLYKDDIDAKIQVAYIAMKSGVKMSEIEKITENTITSNQYKLLSEEFLKEFPEKLI